MKRIMIFSLSLLLSTMVFAQKPPKGNPVKAESLLTKNDLAGAKAEIDMAITLEKQNGKSTTWITRGKIYQAIALEGDDSAITTAMEAYAKAREIEPDGNAVQLLDLQNIAQFHGNYFNRASESYNQEDFPASLSYFQKSLMVLPEDSVTLYYGSLAAYQADDKSTALDLYTRMMDLGYANKELYANAIYIAREDLDDNDRAMVVIKKAQEAFPDHNQFRYDEINIYLETGKDDEALEQLQSALEKDPENATLHLQLGLFKDNMGYNAMTTDNWDEAKSKYEEAKGHYSKVLELKKGDDFVANFNLGVIYVNLAKQYYDEVRDMDITTYRKSGSEMTEKANGIIKQAVPLISKATELNDKDVEAWKALQQIYTQLKMNDKAEEAFNMVEKLEGGN